MNFWTGLILGLIIGWVIEWIIDWLFWRRGRDRAYADLEARLAASQGEVNDLHGQLNANSEDLDGWRSRYASLETDCQARIETLEAAIATLRADAEAMAERAAPTIAVESERSSLVRVPDDLTRIKGIGPRFAEKLSLAGITTFGALAAADTRKLPVIIEAKDWQRVDYDTWVVQADNLAKEPPLMRAGDDLTIIEGIGPNYDARLRENGITTFVQLAATDEVQLGEIIQAPAWRKINYGDWIEQGRLAAAGDLEGLRVLQDRLNRPESDRLERIYGIGDRAAGVLTEAEIDTYSKLAAATPEQLAGIMAAAGVRSGDYEGWIEEARLRAAGRRVARRHRLPEGAMAVSCPQDLSAVAGIGSIYEQKLYTYGIGSYWELSQLTDDVLADIIQAKSFQHVDFGSIRASAQEWAMNTNTVNQVWDGTEPDDFELLAGIGELYERRLYNAGICNYEALAATSVERLAEICQAPRMRTPDYGAWVEEAQALAAEKGG